MFMIKEDEEKANLLRGVESGDGEIGVAQQVVLSGGLDSVW